MEAVAGDKHHSADAGRRRRTARLAHAFHREAGDLGVLRAPLQLRDRRKIGIEQIEIGNIARELIGIGEACVCVLGRNLGHGRPGPLCGRSP